MKWEYHVHVVDNDGDGAPKFSIDDLNALGDEGWELLHVNRLQGVTTVAPGGEQMTRTKRVAIWFKRPREE
ncbi:MAG: hypothetical protein O3B31_13330 [Chloroflexi bacterium]|nr:hypothetical protein [Chloroflexota bacterium]